MGYRVHRCSSFHLTNLKQANIVIINAGTNDATRNIDPGNAGARMDNILNDIWAADGMANTCVMLSTVLDTTDATGSVTRLTINGKYRELVTKRAKEGRCIYLADMDPPYPAAGSGWISWADYDPAEGIKVHPNVSSSGGCRTLTIRV